MFDEIANLEVGFMLGDQLRKKRKEKKLTQKEVAEIIDVDHTTVSKWESNTYEPDAANLNKLAELYGVTVDFLLGREIRNEEYPSWATSKDKRDARNFLEQQEVMFDGVPMSEEDKAKVIGFMESMFWDAKKRNKRKQTE